MWSRVKKTTGDSRNTWTEYTDSQGSGTGQGRNATFTINLKVKSGSGNVKKPPNIAAKYDAIITYTDNSVYQIPSANFWTTETSSQANFEFTNPYPNKTVKTIQVKWYSYSSTATTCNLTYLGGTPIVLSTITDNPISLELDTAQRAKQVSATYTPKQDYNGYDAPWPPMARGNLFDQENAPRLKKIIDANGVLTNNGTAYAVAFYCEPNTTYTCTEFVTATFWRAACINQDPATAEDGAALTQVTRNASEGSITITTEADTVAIVMQYPSGIASTKQISVVLGADAPASYLPYENECPIGITVDLFATAGKNMTGIANYKSAAGVTWTVNADGTISTTGQATANTYLDVPVPSFLHGDYTYCGSPPNGSNATYYLYGRDQTLGARTKKWDGTTNSGYSYGTVPQQVKFTKGHNNVLRCYIASGVNTDGLVWTPMILKKGDNDATYTAPQNDEHTVNFAETIYGGTYYAGGAFDEEYVNIASYNGETINEPWLSSLDEYTPGGTPTTGAQVVYPANQVVKTVAADAVALNLIQGTNNVFANEADDITLSYEAE